MKVFVTGVSGQLGHDVVEELKLRGYDVVASDILFRDKAEVNDNNEDELTNEFILLNIGCLFLHLISLLKLTNLFCFRTMCCFTVMQAVTVSRRIIWKSTIFYTD